MKPFDTGTAVVLNLEGLVDDDLKNERAGTGSIRILSKYKKSLEELFDVVDDEQLYSIIFTLAIFPLRGGKASIVVSDFEIPFCFFVGATSMKRALDLSRQVN